MATTPDNTASPASALKALRHCTLFAILLAASGTALAEPTPAPPLANASAPNTTTPAPASAPANPHPHTIVFIHGMFMTPAAWDSWQSYFQQQGYTTLAPAWPLHGAAVAQQQAAPAAGLGALTLDDVVESYREVLKQLPDKPIVIGHSMGGLVAQKLLAEGLAAEAVAIDSAPPSGLIVLDWSFLRSNWAVVSPFASAGEPYTQTPSSFRYAFANCLPDDEATAIFQQYIVPESRRVGRGTSAPVAKIDFSQPHGPLLLIAGGDDHIIPADLNRKNFERYSDAGSVTDFRQFDGRCHTLTVDRQWRDVADYVKGWLGRH